MKLYFIKSVCLLHQWYCFQKAVLKFLCSFLPHVCFVQRATIHVLSPLPPSSIGKFDNSFHPSRPFPPLFLPCVVTFYLYLAKDDFYLCVLIEKLIIKQIILDTICEFKNRSAIFGATWMEREFDFMSLSWRTASFLSMKSVNASWCSELPKRMIDFILTQINEPAPV